MNARQFMVVGVALIALAGCSSSAGDPGSAAQPQVPVVDPGASEAAAKRAAAAGDADSYVAALKAIDPKLGTNQAAALDNGKTICLDIEQKKTDAELAKNAATRFDVDKGTAAKVVAATRKALCPAA
ncbi:DUF732 domain-containing protein [Paractinoplanes durhamensis]|uniref:DUF732 domain-containing protein n=1 Tax=Paractinoplanes durhamensis TaxID=113563 RepID=UPI0019415F2A|nr:DUF732 domain-containing protein [Actinoplanes durhamensis]